MSDDLMHKDCAQAAQAPKNSDKLRIGPAMSADLLPCPEDQADVTARNIWDAINKALEPSGTRFGDGARKKTAAGLRIIFAKERKFGSEAYRARVAAQFSAAQNHATLNGNHDLAQALRGIREGVEAWRDHA